MLKLYLAPGTCALASHIALAEAGADYTIEKLNFKANQQNSPEYLEINPKGRVPSLVTDRGILTETPAMLVYIAQTFPKARLAPLDDAFAFAQVQSFNSYLCATVHVAHAHKMRGARWATEETSFADMKRMVPKTVGACFALIENKMLKGPWVMGDTYTICESLSLHDRALARRRQRRSCEPAESRRSPQADGRADRSEEGDGGRGGLILVIAEFVGGQSRIAPCPP
jgi:glutathione S-transferase